MLTAYGLVVHSGLLLHDLLSNFAPFLAADRSQQRADAMVRLLSAGSWPEIRHALISNRIIVGEYLVQAVLYGIGGPLAIVLFQIMLQLFAVLAVFRMAQLVLNSPGKSFAAALIYASLPHGLVFPHQLWSEAIGVPLMLAGYWLFFEYRLGGKSIGYLMTGGVMLGLSACVRPQLLLLPVLLLPFALRNRSRQALGGALRFAALGLLPVLLWVALIWSGSHQLSLGNENGSLGFNLYLRVLRISHTVPPAEGKAITDRYLLRDVPASCAAELRTYSQDPQSMWGPGAVCTLSLPQYISFVTHYPAASMRDLFRDILTLTGKSGMSKLTIDYFNPSSQNRVAIQSMKYGWRTIWESQGLLAAIRAVATVSLAIALAELVGAAAFSVLSLGFVLGLIASAQKPSDSGISADRRVGLHVLAVHALYIFATTLSADAAQSRHRHPAEFAMCILAVLGATTVLPWVMGLAKRS